LREMDLYKLPGVAETLDWTTALVALDQHFLDPVIVDETLGAVLKYQDDVDKIKGEQAHLILERVQAGAEGAVDSSIISCSLGASYGGWDSM